MSDTVEVMLKVERSEFDFDGRTDELSFSYPNIDLTSPFFGLGYAQAGALLGAATGQDIGSDDGKQNYKRNTNADESSNTETNNVTQTLNREAEAFTLTSVTAYLDYDLEEITDTGASGFDVWLANPSEEDYDQFSQEIRFASPGGESFDWIAGVYYQDWDLDFDVSTDVPEVGLFSALGALSPALGVLADLTQTRKFSGR